MELIAALMLAAAGGFATMGQYLLSRGYGCAPAAQIAPFTYTSVVFAAVYGWLFWQELPGWMSAAGTLLVVIASIGCDLYAFSGHKMYAETGIGVLYGKKDLLASVVRLAKNCAEISMGDPVDVMTNIKMNLADVDENLSAKDFYGKVVRKTGENGKNHEVHFTSVPPEVDAYFQAHLQYAAKGMLAEKT